MRLRYMFVVSLISLLGEIELQVYYNFIFASGKNELNSKSDENLFCNRAYRNQNFMVTWPIY